MTTNQEEAFNVAIEDLSEVSVAEKTKRAYDIADNAATEYFGLPGPKSALGLMAKVGSAFTYSKEDFPAEMKEVIFQRTIDKARNYRQI